MGAKRILVKAAELGYITEVMCGMPECFCPEELGGARYFEPATAGLSDWSPTLEHFPLSKREGGRESVDNAVLAHRLCNRMDYSVSVGRSHERDLERIRKAREAAGESDPRPVAPAPAASAPRVRKPRAAPTWRTLPPAEMAAHLLAVPTIADTSWTDAPRLRGESRAAFIVRLLTPPEDAA